MCICRRPLSFVLLVVFLVASGCEEEGELIEVETSQEAIHRGEDLTHWESVTSGVVHWPAGCSGTLLNKRWVITAAHCFTSPNARDDDNDGEIDYPKHEDFRIYFGSIHKSQNDYYGQNHWSPVSILPDRIIKHPKANWGSVYGDFDIALMHLEFDAPAESMDPNHFIGGRRPIYRGRGSLHNSEVTLMGYGHNYGYEGTSDGSGIFRRSRRTITNPYGSVIWEDAATPGGEARPGDSGGAVFLDDYGPSKNRTLVGVIKGPTKAIGIEYFLEWVEQQMDSEPIVKWSCPPNSGCSTIPEDLPNNINTVLHHVPHGWDDRYCYDVVAEYDFEPHYDYVTIGGVTHTGKGTYRTRYCGALPIEINTDWSVNSAGVTVTNSNFRLGERCTINLHRYTHDCTGRINAQLSYGGTAWAEMDIHGARDLTVSLMICDPAGWVLNLGNSPTNDGSGRGDSGDFTNDSELRIFGSDLDVWGRAFPSPRWLASYHDFISPVECSWRTLRVRDRHLELLDRNRTIASNDLFRINAADPEGQPDALLYLGLNRVIANPYFFGSGVQKAVITIRE